ncbi:hypothetical protein RD110_22285 [Rhodoferax koreense]|uniref:Response regulatory domain-containing protein n=1 Tax=Rhodoferax koreensis TaxID=1842727 RepID=A0A1P8K0S6_9BURK|nr:response regulator [Rhodoferax koreense]APW39597.1 hypothetical protein RD110_22285 [Rhodoferax koreense]
MRKLVFVSDDYDGLAALMAEFLKRRTDWDAAAMKDGAEVLEEARRRRPDICILDIDMPRIGGIQAARELRRMFPGDTPLLVGMSGIAPLATLSGVFDHVFAKPLDIEELVRRIDPSQDLMI